MLYLTTCQCCRLRYVGSAINFKERFRIHKSNKNTGKRRCGIVKHFLECCTSGDKFDNLTIHLIESMNVPNNLLDQNLW